MTRHWPLVRITARHPWLRRLSWVNAGLGVLLVPLLIAWGLVASHHAGLVNSLNDARRQMVAKQQGGRVLQVVRASTVLVPQFEQKLSTAAGQSQTIDLFLRLGRRHGVRLHGMTFDTRKPVDRHQPLLIELRLQGRYPALRNLFRELQDLPLWAEIQEFRMEADRSGAVRARVRVLSYRPLEAP